MGPPCSQPTLMPPGELQAAPGPVCSAMQRSQATVLRRARPSPTALIRGRILASSPRTSFALAELQLTSMDERHKTSAPNQILFSKLFFFCFFLRKGEAELPCAPVSRAVVRAQPGGILHFSKITIHSDQLTTLIPPCCHHTTSLKPRHISPMLRTGQH